MTFNRNWLSNWSKRIKLTINKDKIDSNLSNFPVLIKISFGSGINNKDLTGIFDEMSPEVSSLGGITGLDAEYTMDSINGGTLYDTGPNGYHGTLVNANEVVGIYGNAINCYGADSEYVRLPIGDNLLENSTEYSISCWMKPSDTYAGSGFQFCLSYTNHASPYYVITSLFTSTYIQCRCAAGSNLGKYNGVFDTNFFYHVVITFLGGTRGRLYLDGRLVDTNNSVPANVGSTHAYLDFSQISALTPNPGNSRETTIDEFRVFDHALTQAEVSTLYSNNKKIAVTTSDGLTQCPVEIERWDKAVEEAELWVKIPTVDNEADTVLYLYYDYDKDDNTAYVGETTSVAAKSVWNSNFKSVYHMSQDPSMGSGCILDSTSHVYHATPSGSMLFNDLIDGKVGKAIDFDGTDDFIDCGSGASVDDMDVKTIEFTFRADTWGESNAGRIIQKAASNANGWNIFINGSGGYENLGFMQSWDSSLGMWYTSPGTISLSTWYTGAIVYDRTSLSNDPIIYINGVSVSGTETTTPDGLIESDAAQDMLIGARNNAGPDREFGGIIDEIRISNIDRTASWIKASHYNTVDDLITYGNEQLYPPGYISGIVYDKYGFQMTEVCNVIVSDLDGEFVDFTTTSGNGTFNIPVPAPFSERFIVTFFREGHYRLDEDIAGAVLMTPVVSGTG